MVDSQCSFCDSQERGPSVNSSIDQANEGSVLVGNKEIKSSSMLIEVGPSSKRKNVQDSKESESDS
jgi:hypothetical protein